MNEQINPSLFHWGYLALKPILEKVKQFAKMTERENARKILDLGCGMKPYESLFSFTEDFIGFDVRKNQKVDVVGLNWDLPFQDDEFDALISTQVLEHTAKISETVEEIRRVVKNKGLVFISAPFVFPEHGIPYDFYRFTKFGLQEIFNGFTVLEITPLNGYLNTLLRLCNIFLHYLPGSQMLFPVYFVVNVLATGLDSFFSILIKISGGKFCQAYFGMPENYVIVMRNNK